MHKIALPLALMVGLAAAPSLAAISAAEPPVPGGDLGCVLRLATLVAKAGRTAEDTSASTEQRDHAARLQETSLEEEAYFLGRLSMHEGDEQRRTDTAKLFKAFRAQSADQQAREIATCSKWSRDQQVETLETLKSKP